MERLVVTVKQGQLQGIIEDSVVGCRYLAYRGIPYAAPPVGELRFKDPEPPASWEGIRDAFKVDELCIRLRRFPPNVNTFGKEDCLYLNVYIPYNIFRTRGNPVMVWIHGYLENTGSELHVGPDYLMKKDVILVSISYRVGALGFLNIGHEVASGNQGLKDQVAALKWVKENIENFSGDPNNITVFGASAGASCTHLLLLSPLSKGLFHKAILQSGTATCPWVLIENTTAEDNAFKLASILGNDSKDPKEVIEFLQTISAVEIISAQDKISSPTEASHLYLPFGPTIDENSKRPFLPCPPSQLLNDDNDIPIIIGCNSHEYIMFLEDDRKETLERRYADIEIFIKRLTKLQDSTKMRQLTEQVKQHYFLNEPVTEEHISSFIQCLGDLSFSIPAKKFVNDQRKKKKTPIYYYNFSYNGSKATHSKVFLKTPMIGLGASHTDEMSYLFYNKVYRAFLHPKLPDNRIKDQEVVKSLTTMWTNFAKTGNPTPTTDYYVTTIWKPATIDSFNYLDIGNSLQLLTVTDDDNLLKMFQNL